MKKIGLIAIAVLFAFSVCACSRKDTTAPTMPQEATQTPTVAPTTLPEIDPTLDTNIPDPHINTEIPTYTDPLDDLNPDLTN